MRTGARIAFFIIMTVVASFWGPINAFGFSKGDGRLCLYSYHVGEALETTYRRGGRYDRKSLKAIEHIFRSRSDDEEHPIDVGLIELLDHIQDHFGADCIEIISGYRSPALNSKLREEGTNVSEESLHMEGKAADIHIDEVSEEKVTDYVRSLKAGGVGYYPAWDFVHVDVGDVRKWDLPDKPGRLLMAMRKGAKWQVTTDRNLYLPAEPVPIQVMNITRTPKEFDGRVEIELFRRGKWKKVADIKVPEGRALASGESWGTKWVPTKKDAFGKYRLVIPGPEGFAHLEVRSNEFYRKRM